MVHRRKSRQPGAIRQARAHFTELTTIRELTPDGLELASIGWIGIAEVDRALGDTTAAARHYEHAMETFGTNDQRNSPWYLMAIAGLVSGTTFDGSLPPHRIAWWARRLRTRALGTQRMRTDFIDKPVLGTVLAGWSAWALTEPSTRDRGLEALALAELLGARQDLRSLHLDTHWIEAEPIVGAQAIEAREPRHPLCLAQRSPVAPSTCSVSDFATEGPSERESARRRLPHDQRRSGLAHVRATVSGAKTATITAAPSSVDMTSPVAVVARGQRRAAVTRCEIGLMSTNHCSDSAAACRPARTRSTGTSAGTARGTRCPAPTPRCGRSTPKNAKIQLIAQDAGDHEQPRRDHAGEAAVGSVAHDVAHREGDRRGDRVAHGVGQQRAGERRDAGDRQRPEAVEHALVHVFAQLHAGDDRGRDDGLHQDARDEDRQVVRDVSRRSRRRRCR